MKKIMLIICILGIMVPAIAQDRAVSSKEIREMGIIINKSNPQTNPIAKKDYPIVKSNQFYTEEEQIGYTKYDCQSSGSTDSRVYLYEDGTIGATWTYGMTLLTNITFSDRGSGYNYFDGSNWGEWPDKPIENDNCGWPSYTPLGENGEMVISHTGGYSGLVISTRKDKGTGEWSYSTYETPAGCPPLVWNSTITSGTDHNRIHMLVCSYPGYFYQGLQGAILYSMSTDGGLTWDIENIILDG
ncbi:MAG: glycoside hydrolase, partial [Bacteroidales bacterium]|nr:glycoside hydrolase [Bacteroidales bacterium]